MACRIMYLVVEYYLGSRLSKRIKFYFVGNNSFESLIGSLRADCKNSYPVTLKFAQSQFLAYYSFPGLNFPELLINAVQGDELIVGS
jgi:hypothetical protein